MSQADLGRSTETVASGQPDNLPAITDEQLGQISKTFGALDGAMLHNFQGDQREVWKQTAKATGGEAVDASAMRGEVFSIQHFYVHEIQLRDVQTGKYSKKIRSVLIDPNGKQVAVVSDGVAKDLAGMIHVFGLGAWNPPVEVTIEQVKTRAGFQVYRLVPTE